MIFYKIAILESLKPNAFNDLSTIFRPTLVVESDMRTTGDQKTVGLIPARPGNTLSCFLLSFSPFH